MKTRILGFAHLGFMANFLFAAEPPPELLDGLTSEDFRVREKSQEELQTWATHGKNVAVKRIFELSLESADPEIRQRCAAILRQLSDADYLSGGSGFLGIVMQDLVGRVPGDDQPRSMIRIQEVVAGSPASKAELKVGDLIIALDGQIWREGLASPQFKEAVSAKKPMEEIELEVRKREGELVKLKVILARNPVPELMATRYDLKFLDEQAREQHFRQWMEDQGLKAP